MPELPEVESARQVIEASGLGRRIVEVDDHDTYECRPHRPGEIRAALLDRHLTAAHRRGKLMWCETSAPASAVASRGGPGPLLGLHLGMSGRILVEEPDEDGSREGGDAPGPSGATRPRKEEWYRFTLTFDDGGRLRLLDKRRLGRVRLDPDLDALGPDAGEIGREEFRARVGRGTAPLKARLLDQATLAGVGNLLADEVLWQARLSPLRPVGELGTDELDALRRALRQGIRSAIRQGGVHTGEVVPHRGRGRHCPRCGAEMTRATVGSRTTWWCPAEQH
ncbi:formamidopyrimidine-DNA glycosylase [Nocardioides scoriae]|uniref:Formamidopyrimidine-DNA glycosylase n=1 Tax=Nocardioides scoriae TaxID=642780 RepID=A0A1H1WSJ0_9ACTN|nr:DNA-formamidopyrimidine glycosylase family protein [Nocardioides scoriae]SDS99621.1 formamidopyrimidine-DNA glycosylase [Nocardioides scoriae]